MKLCPKCNMLKSEDEFNKNKNRRDGLSVYCKACRHDYNMQNRGKISERNLKYRIANRDKLKQYRVEHRDAISKYNKQWVSENKERVKAYNRKRSEMGVENLLKLKTSCVKCGEDRAYVIDFHHIDPRNKTFNLSTASHHTFDELLEESKKCVCMCKNCHTEFHWLYGSRPNNPTDALNEYLQRGVTDAT